MNAGNTSFQGHYSKGEKFLLSSARFRNFPYLLLGHLPSKLCFLLIHLGSFPCIQSWVCCLRPLISILVDMWEWPSIVKQLMWTYFSVKTFRYREVQRLQYKTIKPVCFLYWSLHQNIMNWRLQLLPLWKLNLAGFAFVAFYVKVLEKWFNSSFWNILAEGGLIINDVNV